MTARSTRNLLRQSIMIWIVREESPAIGERLNGLVKQSRLSSMRVFDIPPLAAIHPALRRRAADAGRVLENGRHSGRPRAMHRLARYIGLRSSPA